MLFFGIFWQDITLRVDDVGHDSMENSESFSVMQRIKHKAIWYICQIHTNGKYEYFKCKLKSIGWEGGSEDAVCPC